MVSEVSLLFDPMNSDRSGGMIIELRASSNILSGREGMFSAISGSSKSLVTFSAF